MKLGRYDGLEEMVCRVEGHTTSFAKRMQARKAGATKERDGLPSARMANVICCRTEE